MISFSFPPPPLRQETSGGQVKKPNRQYSHVEMEVFTPGWTVLFFEDIDLDGFDLVWCCRVVLLFCSSVGNSLFVAVKPPKKSNGYPDLLQEPANTHYGEIKKCSPSAISTGAQTRPKVKTNGHFSSLMQVNAQDWCYVYEKSTNLLYLIIATLECKIAATTIRVLCSVLGRVSSWKLGNPRYFYGLCRRVTE